MFDYPALQQEFEKEVNFGILTPEQIEYILRAYSIGYEKGRNKGKSGAERDHLSRSRFPDTTGQ